jgi:hypothetical protein
MPDWHTHMRFWVGNEKAALGPELLGENIPYTPANKGKV